MTDRPPIRRPYDWADDDTDDLAPARGILTGVALGGAIWLTIWAIVATACGALLGLIGWAAWKGMP